MYKLTEDGNCIIKRDDLGNDNYIPIDSNNRDYQQFVKDIQTKGLAIVEGATVVGVVTYTEARASEYPSLQEQQDMQYWDAVNGTTTWKDKIAEIKAKYPKSQVGVTTIAAIPESIRRLYESSF